MPDPNYYESILAGVTSQPVGPTGAKGDYLAGLLVIPATTSPGVVTIQDGSNTAITVFAGGASSVSSLVPFFVPVNASSGNGAWKVTTGSDVSVIASGYFT